MGSNRAAIEVNRGYPARMATITGATGGSWEPALRTTVRNVAAQQQVIQSWGDAMARQRTQWAALAKQVSQVRQQTSQISEAARRASEVSRSISMLQPQLQAWRQHQEQIVRTVRLLQDLPSLRMGFDAPTLDRATELLEELGSSPTPQVPAAMDAAALELPDAVVQEAVEAAEPAVQTMDRATARSLVVAVVATFVFLKVIQWAVEHPDAADEIMTVGTLAWFCASVAANQAGRLWDNIFGARSTDRNTDLNSGPDPDN